MQLSLAEARRIALAASGLGGPRPARAPGEAELAATVRRLGLVQLDFVTVLAPAHLQVLFSRHGPYDRALLDRLLFGRRELLEQWAREASIVPVEAWPLLAHRRAAHRPRPWSFEPFLRANPGYARRLLAEIRERGALGADEVPDPDGHPARLEHSWYGSARRATLEALFGSGVLAIAGRRPDLSRLYDLAERVVPERHRARSVAPEEARRELVRAAARAQGVATAGDLADHWRMPVGEARRAAEDLAAAGELLPARVEGWREPAWLHPSAAPSRGGAAALLSPFDPLVWTRRRAARLFGFDYRLEIFVPEARRRWGTYVLPFLLGDRLVARADLKAERAAGRLLVRSAHLEPGAAAGPVAAALARELRALAGWLGLGEVRVERRGALARALAAALRPRPGRARRRSGA